VAQRKVLLIDDSQFILDIARSALESAGYSVATAATVEAFEAERQREPPDLIVVDIQMPEMFGDDLASTLRGAYGVTTPIVFLSGLEEEDLAERALESGVRAWVTKKKGIGALVAKVNEILGESSPS
jgi:DNA-binding response OmpR family regulator